MKLKYKIVTYSPEGLDEGLLDQEKDGMKYLSKKAFDKAADDGLEYRIVGKTRLKEAGEDDEKVLTVGEKRYLLEDGSLTRVVGYIPVGDGGFVEYRKSVLLLLILLIGLVSVGILWGLVKLKEKPPAEILAPDFDNLTVDENQESVVETSLAHTMIITVPEGDVEFMEQLLDFENEQLRMKEAEYEENAYSGTLHMTAYFTKEEEEYLVFDADVTVADGALQEAFIDYLIQKTELVSNIYDGRLILDYGQAGKIEEPLTLVVRNRYGGTVGISFSPEVDINRQTKDVTLYYRVDQTATHDTVLQLILDKNGEEYLLAESGLIQPGHAVSHMTLSEEAAGMLTSGGYSGRLRVTYFDEEHAQSDDNVNTDIAVTINVH